MTRGAASKTSSNVAAAAAVRFSVDVNPSYGSRQPSVLLLTQNVGGIEAGLGTVNTLVDGSPDLSPTAEQLSGGGLFPSIITSITGPSYAQIPDDIDAETGVSAVVRQQVADFLADLRVWLHRMCYASAAARAAESAQTKSSPSSGSTPSSSPRHPHHPGTATTAPHRQGSHPPGSTAPLAGQSIEVYLRGYTPAARPPLIDVIVLHFQEIGGKYKNKHFNRYFKEQLAAVLLPEAGWTSGLLMDERESDRVVVSSSACRRVVNVNAIAATASAMLRSSPTSSSGHLRAPTWEYADSASHRSSNEVSGAETDVSEEEAADPYFTAIGSIVFLSPRVMGISSCLSVPHRTYIPIEDDPVTYAGDAGRLFHSGKFSEAGRSRKGFLLISLRVGTVQFNVCNLHLFNDDDNRLALEQSPSTYTARRTRAVQEAMAECSAVVDLAEPLFLFGDYNVRMDGKALVQWAEEKEHITIRPGKKQLRCPEHFWDFFADASRVAQFRQLYDAEPQRLMDELAVQTKVELGEMPVGFAPTYSRVPYRSRGAATSASASAALKEVHSSPLHTSPMPEAAGGSSSTATTATTPRSHLSSGRGNRGGGAGHDGEPAELAETQRPSSTRPSRSPQTQAGAAAAVAVAEPLTHVVAAANRDNYCRDRLPAWCDRVFFNVAGLEWIAGDRARPPTSSAAAAAAAAATTGGNGLGAAVPASAVRDRRRAEGVSATAAATALQHQQHPARWYAYEAMDFVHMDHDGVYLLF